jgi:hypothetical protein
LSYSAYWCETDGHGEAIAKLKQHEAARREAREDSDIDLFFDHPEGSRILGRKTDIMTRRSLHPVLRERIEASALQVFCWRCRLRSHA